MIPEVVIEYIDEYINQEVYVQIAIIKGKEKTSIDATIDKYFNTNHFKDFSEGKPYFYFIEGLKDKCLGKLKNSPMKNKKTNDPTINLLQKKLIILSDEELEDTFWEIETGEFFSRTQIQELENECSNFIKEFNTSDLDKKVIKNKIIRLCKNYEKLCEKKYPEAILPLNMLKNNN